MAEESEGDILVMIKGSSGLIEAECLEQVHGTDMLAKDFKAGCYFQVSSFSFGVNIQDDDTSKTTTQTGKNEPKKQKFSSWISNGAAAKTYPVELDEFEFERTMDKASPLLFQACVNKETLPSIVLIKRKDIGSKAGRDAYLRLEFSEVLMISIDWNTAPQVKEKCKFIARKVQIQYRPQAHAGALGKVIPAEFSYTFTKTG